MSKKTTSAFLLPMMLASTLYSHADIEFKRPLQLYKEQNVQVGAEYSYFDLDLDFLDYASKLEGRSTPERNEAIRLDLHLPLAERITLDYQRSDNEGLISRTAQPFKTLTKGFDHQLDATYWLFRSNNYSIFLHAGLKYAKQDPVKLDCYDYSGLVVIGGTCEEADFQLLDGDKYLRTREFEYFPVMETDANTLGFKVGATLTNQFLGISTYQYLGFEQTEVNVRLRSALLDITDPFLLQVEFQGLRFGDVLDTISEELPQDEPWLDRTFTLEAGAKRQISSTFFVTGSLTHYMISRDSYILGEQETEYNNNTALNLAIWFEPSDTFSVYLRGETSTNNVLGFEPIAYNRKSSKYFKHPFGQLSLGFTIKIP